MLASKLKMVMMNNFMRCCLILWLISSSSVVSSIKIEGGAYQNIVIEIQNDVPRTNCLDFLRSLQNNLQAASEKLYSHSSLNERIYYGSFDIILPTNEWFDLCIGNSTIKNHNGAKSDVIVTDNSVIFGDNIWTLQNQCHEEGEQIYMSYKSLMHQDNNEFPERFTEEWLKYRYGVFDEDGFVGDEIFPQCSHYPTTSSILKSSNSNSSNGNGNWLCQDALEIQSTLFNNEASSNNRYLPTKQNFKCHGKSKLDVVLKSTDFASYINSQPVQIHKTQFNYVRRALTRYVVIIEDHFDVNIRDSFQFMKTALRKWINIDLEQNTSEVGIVMMKQNETNIMNEIKIAKIDSSENRENVLASIPLYLDNTYKVQKNKKCSLQSYLAKSFEALKMKSRMSRSEDVIIVIAPGMYECNDENSKRIVEDIENAGIKLITINYPQIGSNRVELDRLSETIESFTIFEEKQNEERSLLNTFFDLSNTLMAISHSHSSKSDLMPVEIYRKQIGEDKNQLDSFNVDEATDDIQFFVYFYDRKERNFETNFKVTSPSNKVFEKLSEQRAEYHQLGVLGKLSEVGSWSYNIKRFFSPQPTFIQVLAHPKQGQQHQFIRVKAWTKKIDNHGNFIVYCKVFKGNTPINDASVELTVSLADHFMMKNNVKRFLLLDNGSEPDVTKYDGIYSKYLNLEKQGVYRLDIIASSNGDVAYTQSSDNEDVECCGSSITTQGRKRTVPSFQRYVRPLFVYANNQQEQEQQHYNGINVQNDIYARISDLKISQVTNDSKVILEFTEPDVRGNFDPYESTLFYEIWFSTNLRDILDNVEITSNKIEQNSTLKHSGERKSVVFDLKEHSMIGRKVFIGVGIRDKSQQAHLSLSNVVGVFVKPHLSHTSGQHASSDDSDGSNISILSSDNHENFLTANVILIVGLLCLLVVFALIICLCCVIRRKYKSKKKKSDVASVTKQNISINVVSQPSMYEKMNQSYTQDLPKQAFFTNSTMYDDHDNMNNLSYNIYDQQFPRTENNQIFDDTSILNTNENVLNSYDCWTASQLLNVHEKNNFMQLDVEKESDSIYNTNYPPISLSRHELYSTSGDVMSNNIPYAAASQCGLPPPIYSSLRRDIFPSDEYSPYSDKSKKIRNVTIV